MSIASGIPSEMDMDTFKNSHATHVKVIKDTVGFASMSNEWSELFNASGKSNIYQTFDWLYTWWRWFGELPQGEFTSRELSIVCVYLGESLIGVAPFYIDKQNHYAIGIKKTLRLLGQPERLGDMPSCEQLDIISSGEKAHQEILLDTLCSFISKNSSYSRLLFHRVKKNSILYQLIKRLPPNHTSGLNTIKSSLSISLPESFEEFTTSQSKSWKINYRGFKRMLKITGKAEVRWFKKPDDIHCGLESLAQIMCAQQRKSSEGRCFFDVDHYMRFHEDVCHLLATKEHVEIASLIMDGRLLASVCYYQHNGVLQVYKMASIRGDGIRFSPLFLLMTEVVKQAINDGKSRVDFLSNCACVDPENSMVRGMSVDLYTLRWFKNRSKAYLVKSARKLYKILYVDPTLRVN